MEVEKRRRNCGAPLPIATDKEEEQLLLPGLGNHVTLGQVVPKLPWNVFHILSSVSRPWRRAIRSHEVFNARVRSHSTETLVALNHTIDFRVHAISLYSLKDDSWHDLPPFPWSRRGVPGSCQCVTLDGKLYILGGEKAAAKSNSSDDSEDEQDTDDGGEKKDHSDHRELEKNEEDNGEVYVLDLAGPNKWKRCASMPQGRLGFGCGVVNGKIYLFGGFSTTLGKPALDSAVYDPKENAWSSVMPMKRGRSMHHVVTAGEELFVHGGRIRAPYGNRFRIRNSDEQLGTKIYHAGMDSWRVLKPFGCHSNERLFTVRGKIHLMTPMGIFGHHIDDSGNYSWLRLHSYAFEDVDEDEKIEVCAVEAVNDELLALFTLIDPREEVTVLYASKGFGSDKEQIMWRTVDCERLEYHLYPNFMCPVLL